MQLRDQHVFITGGSSGIGLALARQSVAAGARVSIIGRDVAKLTAARNEINAAHPGTEVVTASADVSVESEILAALQTAEAVHGPVDILITSAGTSRPGYFEEIPMEVFKRTMAVNYFGTLYPLKAVVPAMRQRDHGAIVLISSGVGLYGFFGYSPYAPSKFALRGLAETLRAELKQTGVGVTIVYPPDTDTPQLAEENLTKPIETKALTATGGFWSADDVARVTLKAVRRGRFSVTPGFQISALAWWSSFLAPFFNWGFDRTARKAREQADKNATKS